MAGRKVKCRFCSEEGNSLELIKGITKTGYIHEECIPKYQEEEDRKRIDKEQLDELYNYLKQLYNAAVIPKWSLTKIQDLKRESSVTYKMILDAYKLAEDKIRWFMNNVNDSNNASGINAGFTLMQKWGLNEIFKQEKARKRREEEQQKQIKQTTAIDMSLELKINKIKNDEMDISDLL